MQVGWSEDMLGQALEAAPQPEVFRLLDKMKAAAFDPNDVGDRMYPTLPLHPGVDASGGRRRTHRGGEDDRHGS